MQDSTGLQGGTACARPAMRDKGDDGVQIEDKVCEKEGAKTIKAVDVRSQHGLSASAQQRMSKIVEIIKRKARSKEHQDFSNAVDDLGQLKLPLTWTCVKAVFRSLVTTQRMTCPRKRRTRQPEDIDSDADVSTDSEGQEETKHCCFKNTSSLSLGALKGYRKALEEYYYKHDVPFTAIGVVEQTGVTLGENLDQFTQDYSKHLKERNSRGKRGDFDWTRSPQNRKSLAENSLRQEVQHLREQLNKPVYDLPKSFKGSVWSKYATNAERLDSGDNLEQMEIDMVDSVVERLQLLFDAPNSSRNSCESQGDRSAIPHDLLISKDDLPFHADLLVSDDMVCSVQFHDIFSQNIDCMELWKRWHVGEHVTMDGTCKKIRPLKEWELQEVCDDNFRQNLTKARKVIHNLEHIARKLGVLREGESVTRGNYQAIFHQAYRELIKILYGESAWEQEENSFFFISSATVHRQICSREAESQESTNDNELN
eukprot:753106-Hanusia_phi.AAC.3